MASGGKGGKVLILNLKDGSILNSIQAHTEPVLSVLISPDKTLAVSAAYDKTVKLWHV